VFVLERTFVVWTRCTRPGCAGLNAGLPPLRPRRARSSESQGALAERRQDHGEKKQIGCGPESSGRSPAPFVTCLAVLGSLRGEQASRMRGGLGPADGPATLRGRDAANPQWDRRHPCRRSAAPRAPPTLCLLVGRHSLVRRPVRHSSGSDGGSLGEGACGALITTAGPAISTRSCSKTSPHEGRFPRQRPAKTMNHRHP
jgi:hypothetical protein